MATSFTPGPWRVSADGIWARSPWNAEVKIASVTICSPMNGIDWKANAILIAAAPDMLKALQEVSRCAALGEAWLAPVQAAITKATETTR